MGLWYPKDTAMALTAYADADRAGCQDNRRSMLSSLVINTMADMNSPINDAPAKQAPAIVPSTGTDDQIFPLSKWVPIGKGNCVLNVQKLQRNPIFSIVFWDTMCFDSSTGLYNCQLDEQWFNIRKDALDITPIIDNNPFVAPPSSDIVIEYVNTLGYPCMLKNVSAMSVNALYQPWRAILSMINMCLTEHDKAEEEEAVTESPNATKVIKPKAAKQTKPSAPKAPKVTKPAQDKTLFHHHLNHNKAPQIRSYCNTLVSKVVDEIVTDVVDRAMQAPLRARFSDLPAVDKSLERDYSNQLLSDLEAARQKKERDTYLGLQVLQEYQNLLNFLHLLLLHLLVHQGLLSNKEVQFSDDEDTKSDQLSKANTRKDWWKPLPEEERLGTPEPAWTISSSNMTNPGGDQVKIDVSRPLPLGGPPGHMKAARYPDFGLELLVPEQLWIDDWVFNSLVHSLYALSTLRRSGLGKASAAVKPCQEANELIDAFGKLFEVLNNVFEHWVCNSLVHSTRALSALRRSSLRTASTAAKPCQGDSSKLYLITDSIYTDQPGTVVLATLFNGSEQRHFRSFITNINL
nr:retrovirus-related Pol polyprotein from transposon TNT 1-94 [Tanacetum cinerariifolium]